LLDTQVGDPERVLKRVFDLVKDHSPRTPPRDGWEGRLPRIVQCVMIMSLPGISCL